MTGPARSLLRLALLALCITAVGCGSSERAGAPLRIGINVWPGYEFLHLAKVKGLFEEAGIEVQLVEFSSLSDARRSFERGQLDGMACTMAELVQAAQESTRSPQAVLVIDYSVGGDAIIAANQIESVSALRKQRVGVEFGSVSVYILARALESVGMTVDDVEVVSSDQLMMEKQLLAGELDAVVTYPPTSIRLLESGRTRQLYTSAEIPEEILDLLVFDAAVIDARASEIAGVISAFYRAMEYTKKNPDEAYSIMGAREGLTGEQFKAALTDGIVLVPREDQKKFLGPDGHLVSILPRVEAVMRATRQIERPHRDVVLIRGELPAS